LTRREGGCLWLHAGFDHHHGLIGRDPPYHPTFTHTHSLEAESEGGVAGRKEGMAEAAGTYVSTLAAYEEGLAVVTGKVRREGGREGGRGGTREDWKWGGESESMREGDGKTRC